MSNLFEASDIGNDVHVPLAEKLRPKILADVVGQDHLLSEEGPLSGVLTGKGCPSMILWGPPGCGKTTLARLLADQVDLYFEPLSAIFSGVADLKKIFASAKARKETGQGTLLFVDEIHRFNKSQQDAFLPYVENGTIVLVGATTENPSFELNAALLSRCQVMVLHRLDDEALDKILYKAEQEQDTTLSLTDDARSHLKAMADGDGRFLLNMAEHLFSLTLTAPLDRDGLAKVLHRRAPVYDKGQDSHYNLISALHKSVRGSDADAALYWLARMITGGEDPHYIARRVLRMAVEDIGLADPQAATIALHAWQSFERLGAPEGELAIAQAVTYMATAPKSNAVYSAYKSALRHAKDTGSHMPPKHILNAPTGMMKDLGYGDGYAYDHDQEGAFSGQNYFPDEMARQNFYQPVPRGFEREIQKRMTYWDKKRAEKHTVKSET